MNRKPLLIRILTENRGLKFASVLCGFVLWFLVTNINDPVISRTFYNVPVTLRNTSVLTDAGQVYEVLDNTDNIASVSVTARRSIVETFTRDNILAVADMNNLTGRDTVPIFLSVNRNASDVVSVEGSIEDVRLNIEDRKTRTISLTVNTPGELADGYTVGKVMPAQNLVRITGPASRVDLVASAVAEVDVTGFTSQIGTDADVRLYDAEGVQIRDTALSQNITTVRVQVDILETKEVGVRARYTGAPADGFVTEGAISVTPSTVVIAGDPDTVNGISEIVITADELDISGRQEALRMKVDVRRFLPDGVVLSDPEFNGMAEVVLNIVPNVAVRVEVPVSQIVLENQPEGLSYAIADENGAAVAVTLTGSEKETARVNAGDITLVADVANALEALGGEAPESLAVQARVNIAGDARVAGIAEILLRKQ